VLPNVGTTVDPFTLGAALDESVGPSMEGEGDRPSVGSSVGDNEGKDGKRLGLSVPEEGILLTEESGLGVGIFEGAGEPMTGGPVGCEETVGCDVADGGGDGVGPTPNTMISSSESISSDISSSCPLSNADSKASW